MTLNGYSSRPRACPPQNGQAESLRVCRFLTGSSSFVVERKRRGSCRVLDPGRARDAADAVLGDGARMLGDGVRMERPMR